MRIALFFPVLSSCSRAMGIESADPNLIPEARRVLAFLDSIHGKKVPAGIDIYANPFYG